MGWFNQIITLYVIICQVICKVLGGEPYLNRPRIFVTYDNKPMCFRSGGTDGTGNKYYIKHSFSSGCRKTRHYHVRNESGRRKGIPIRKIVSEMKKHMDDTMGTTVVCGNNKRLNRNLMKKTKYWGCHISENFFHNATTPCRKYVPSDGLGGCISDKTGRHQRHRSKRQKTAVGSDLCRRLIRQFIHVFVLQQMPVPLSDRDLQL